MNNDSIIDTDLLSSMRCNTGETLKEVTDKQVSMLVFLRHFGCIFCKEALTEISILRETIEEKGIRIVFVHMSDEKTADKYFKKFGLSGVTHIGDPYCRYYSAFGLIKGSVSQLFGLQVWMRGFSVQMNKGFRPELAKALGDSTQMPGVFIIHQDKVLDKFVHQFASDRPDYMDLASVCETPSNPESSAK